MDSTAESRRHLPRGPIASEATVFRLKFRHTRAARMHTRTRLFFHKSDRGITVVFFTNPTTVTKFQREPSSGGVKYKEGGKI